MPSTPLRKVLYIEDDPHIRKLVQLTLEESGELRVRACGNWHEALNLARAERPDLLLLDVILPEKNGVATLSNLRELPGMSRTPAIFLTVDVELSTADPNADLGPHAVIAKPFQVEQLHQAVMNHWHNILEAEGKA